jgi:hypothetical protein
MTHLKPDLVDNNLTKLLQYIAVAGQEMTCKLIRLFERLRSLNWALQGKKNFPCIVTQNQQIQTPWWTHIVDQKLVACKHIGHPDQRVKDTIVLY